MNPLKTLFQKLLHQVEGAQSCALCTCDDIMPKDCLLQPRVVWWSRCKSFLYFFQAPIPIGFQRGKTLPFSMSGFFLQLIGLFWYHMCKSISYMCIYYMCKSISYISTFPAHLSHSTYVTSAAHLLCEALCVVCQGVGRAGPVHIVGHGVVYAEGFLEVRLLDQL